MQEYEGIPTREVQFLPETTTWSWLAPDGSLVRGTLDEIEQQKKAKLLDMPWHWKVQYRARVVRNRFRDAWLVLIGRAEIDW